MKRDPAEVYHISEFLAEEMLARDWTVDDVAKRMGGPREVWGNVVMLQLIMCIHKDNLIINDEMFSGLARAFGVSDGFFRSIHEQWKAHPDKRSPFTPPEAVLETNLVSYNDPKLGAARPR